MGGIPQKENRVLTIPNMLSMLRLCMIPLFVWLYCVKKDSAMTAAVLLLSGATDVVDGFIARRFGMVSDLGKILDPVADKLTQAAMLLCLVARFPLMAVPFGLMAVKETVSAATCLLVIHRTKRVESSAWHGKAATVLMHGVILTHVLWVEIPSAVSDCLIGACIAMLLLSWALYGMRSLRTLRSRGGEACG